MKSGLSLLEPTFYFHELVLGALSKRKLKPLQETQVYLVNLLKQFISTENLFNRGSDGSHQEQPLALLVKDALEEPSLEIQRLMFRKVGDVSLYVSGFFQDRIHSKAVDLDYYIEMGESAYKEVAAREEKVMRDIFEELSSGFPRFVGVLADVSDQTTLKNETNLLRIYELWERTKSERAAKILKDEGLLPPTPKTGKGSVQ